MILKDGQHLTEAALARPQDNQKAWIDVGGPGGPSLEDVIHVLGWDPVILHQLQLTPDRAQFQYAGDLLLMAVFVPVNEDTRPLAIILGPGVLVTIHQETLPLLEDIAKELPQKVELLESAHYLLYEILERTADAFLERMDSYEEQFDALEEAILDGQDRARQVFALRHTLHHLRGVLADMRRIAARLSRRQFRTSTESAESDASIFVDVYDGFYHVIDNLDSLRDNLTGLVDLQLNQRSTRLNEIMKFLTIFSTIFLPITFITGFFGMNLKPMPELTIPYSQELTVALMLAIAVGMLYVFKRRGWL